MNAPVVPPPSRDPAHRTTRRLPALEREARLEVMDAQGIDRVWMFPTLGMLYEELLKHDTPALTQVFTAFNRWVEEDWGFNFRNRIFAAPYITLADVDHAVAELEYALARDARVVVMRPAAAFTPNGPRTPADPEFDPFWARVNESGITVVVHAGDSGYLSNGYAADGFAATFEGDELDASLLQLVDLRFHTADDPRNVATLKAIEEGLIAKAL